MTNFDRALNVVLDIVRDVAYLALQAMLGRFIALLGQILRDLNKKRLE